ncbi:MAG: hypothetical protein AAGG08_10900, partial [Actinomycetota bacterium]
QCATALATADGFGTGDAVGAIGGTGPFDSVGGIGLWGVEQRSSEVSAVIVVVMLAGTSLALAGRLSVEQLVRRGALVSQLRFAATTQDIRTIVLLRRQLGAEAPRSRPWFAGSGASTRATPAAPPGRRDPLSSPSSGRPTPRPDSRPDDVGVDATAVIRRGVASLRRFPAARVVRIFVLAASAAVAAHLAVVVSPIAYAPMVLLVFLVGLELVEPLAQEIDRPDRTDLLPVDRGRLFVVHLIAPALAAVPVSLLGAVTTAVIEPDHAVAAFTVCVPVAWGGMVGAAISTVRDSSPPVAISRTTITGAERADDHPVAMPEFAGAGAVLSASLPFVVAAISVVPVAAVDAGRDAAAAVRGVGAVALSVGVLVWWIRRRDDWATGVRRFFLAGRNASGRPA